MKNMDLTLITSPVNALDKFMPCYYLYLAGYLEKFGFKISIINPHFKTIEENNNFIIEEVKKLNPKYIGFSCFVTDYDVVSDLAQKVRKVSNAKVLAGNAQPSIAPEDFLYEGSPFDIVVRGEGELTVKEILSSKQDIDTLYKIDGIAFFDKNRVGSDGITGSVVINKNRELMNMKDCGKPAYHLIDVNWYATPTKYVIRRLTAVCTVIYTGRGCPYKCNFCASNVVWNTNSKGGKGATFVRWRPLDVVMEELALLQNKYGFDFFYIHDDTFGINEKQTIAFCEAYKASGLKMLWAAETRVTCIKNPEIVKLLRESGCIQLDFGVESGSPRLLKSIKKLTTVEDTYRAFKLCRQYGMRTFCNMMLNMQGETEEDLELSKKMLADIKPTVISIGGTQPYPGTDLYKSLGFKINKKDYHLLDRIYPKEKFRLASHKLDLKKLIFDWYLKYKIYTLFEKSVFNAGFDYYKKIILSKHRFKYFKYMLRVLLGMPIYYFKVRYNNYSERLKEVRLKDEEMHSGL